MKNDVAFQAFIAGQLPVRPCDFHPEVECSIALAPTFENYRVRVGWSQEYTLPIYEECPKCRAQRIRKWLARAGVPEVLHDCTLDNWTPDTDQERQHLEAVRTFTNDVRRGFLVLLGPVGVGKSHLAVAVLRRFSCPIFIKQSTLLRQLRATYSDKEAADPIERCQEADLLVLDEMCVSGGGRDEWPMLSEILDFRYSHLTPTVITSNLGWDELRGELGDRLGDRMREAAHAVLVFAGASHRAERRDAYFDKGKKPGQYRRETRASVDL
ncbi:MAG: ATP-binding protein [Verrucomicrobia bacterium]|nr:ATP-binding protein [Verrucomicrobiota bacterium]